MNVVWQKKKQVGKTRSSLSNYLSLSSVWYRSNKPADFSVTRSTPSCYVSQQYHFPSIWSMWPDHHYYVIFHNSIWGKHSSKWRAEFGVTINHHCFVICKNSMVCQTLEQVTALSWRDQITTIVIVLKNYKTKTVANNQLSLMWSDHHYQIICYKNWSKRLAKNCATRSSLSHYNIVMTVLWEKQRSKGQTCIGVTRWYVWQQYYITNNSGDLLRFMWPDYHYYVIFLNSILRQIQEQVTSWLGQIIMFL